MGCDLDDEVRFKRGGDPLQQENGRDNAACFQAGQGRLCHAGPFGTLGLREAKDKPSFANCPADQEGPLGLGVSRAVLLAATALPCYLLI